MNIDLSFTKDPAWIEKRERMWKAVYEKIADELSRKQMKIIQKYFMTGEAPNNLDDMFYNCYIKYFPLQSPEGHEYCWKEYMQGVTNHKVSNILNDIVGDSTNRRSDISLTEKINLFRAYVGDIYSPDRKFPFLIGKETECRPFPMDVIDFMWKYCWVFLNWTWDEELEYPVHVYFIDFLFSLFSHVEIDYLTYRMPPEISKDAERSERDLAKRKRYSCQILNKFMRNVFVQNIKNNKDYDHIKFSLNDIKNRFQSADSALLPRELIDHWEVIARRRRMYKMHISNSKITCEDVVAANVMIHAYGFNEEIPEYFSVFGPEVVSKLGLFVTEYGLDSIFNIEDFDSDDDEGTRLDLLCTATEDSVVEAFANILRLCSVESIEWTFIKEL